MGVYFRRNYFSIFNNKKVMNTYDYLGDYVGMNSFHLGTNSFQHSIPILEWIHSNIKLSVIMLELIHSKMEWIHSIMEHYFLIIISVHNFFVIKDREVIPSEINSHYYSWIFPQGLHIKFQKTLVRIHSILVRIHSILERIRTKWNELLPK